MNGFPLEKSGLRYNQWLSALRKSGLLPRERLIPTLEVDVPNSLPALMSSRSGLTEEDRQKLRLDVARHSPWGYSIHLAEGVLTGRPENLERMVYRAHLIGNAIRDAARGLQKDWTVLDMACNHGYFGLQCAYQGATVFGADLRAENIEKAELLKRHFRIERASFAVQSVFETSGAFDVVLNLGLLYHVTDPYMLVKKTYDLCRKFAVIDTITHHSPVSAFIQRTNKNASHHAEGEFNVEYHPTYRALLDLMHSVGFKNLTEIVPASVTGRAQNHLYEKMERRCIIGFR